MLFRAHFLLFFGALVLFFVACDSPAPPPSISSSEPSEDSTPVNFSTFLQQLKQTEAGQDIPSAFHAAYIAPALAKDSLYPYLSDTNASYQYGEMIYEDSSLAILSFYYKALDGRSLLAASFLASYNKITATCLDIRPIFSSSTFDLSTTKGYQLGLSCQSTLDYIENGSLGILQLNSQVKYFYTALEEGIEPRPNQKASYQHVLKPDGHFASRQLSSKKKEPS
ncbi:MAG: hypothetical protein ACRBFS_27225 [Aureispira sp.]